MSNQPPPRILIADDEPLYLRTTAQLLRNEGFDCVCAPTGTAALEQLSKQHFDLVLSDLNMPGNFKLELLQAGRSQWPDCPLIVVTGAPSLPTAIESLRMGITDYLLKPVKLDDLLSSIRRALAHRRRNASPSSATTVEPEPPALPGVVGISTPMRQLAEIVARVANTDTNVLITGESGTGKEAVARAIHQLSPRAAGPFQIIDCTAIPETLFESILFGHARGAFTGAVKDQPGLLQQAHLGSAFFDEIGELPATLQSKLLRVIQEQTFIPVGKTSAVTVDTRFICATNRDLELEVNAGRFRRDLYYRLAVIHIELPPLRARGDDVILLAKHFLNVLAGKQSSTGQSTVKQLSPETEALLRRHNWPGNIRELRNAIERGIAMAKGPFIEPADLPPIILKATSFSTSPATATSTTTAISEIGASADFGNTPGAAAKTNAITDAAVAPVDASMNHAAALDRAERNFLISLIKQNSGNVAQSARQAGLSRQGLHKLLKKHDLDPNEFRP